MQAGLVQMVICVDNPHAFDDAQPAFHLQSVTGVLLGSQIEIPLRSKLHK
jgi:hypothetical protein